MSKRMTQKAIIDKLMRKAELPGFPLTARDLAFNTALRRIVRTPEAVQENFAGNENYYWDGKYVNPMTDQEFAHNEALDAYNIYQAGDEMPTPEKNDEQRKFELRLRCFTMAQQSAPRHMNGAQPEPPAETIKRSMFLEHYFTSGKLLSPEEMTTATGKAK